MTTYDKLHNYIKSHQKSYQIHVFLNSLKAPESEIRQALDQLIANGEVIKTPQGKYTSTSKLGLVPARVQACPDGTLVAHPFKGKEEEMIIRLTEAGLRPAPNDVVLVRPKNTSTRAPKTCEVKMITQHAQNHLDAIVMVMPQIEVDQPFERAGGENRPPRVELRPVDPRVTYRLQLEGGLRGAKDGDMVYLRIAQWPEKNNLMRVEIDGIRSKAGYLRVQLRAVAEANGLHIDFPSDAIEQASTVPTEVSEEEIGTRLDLRDLITFTIDGEDAQDFDDAVSLERVGDFWQLGVHIADVSHYVQRYTPIDNEALARGTSVYIPGMTLPMLPEVLSNHMCSLMPNQDRLTMSLTLLLDEGKVVEKTLSRSVIHSSARLTYSQVNRMLAGEPNNIPEKLHDTLRGMIDVSHYLREIRRKRGGIDFDIPETALTLTSDGCPGDVRAAERGEAERMIEDFMLLANETVAEMARNADLPFLYRIHRLPDEDKMLALKRFLTGINISCRFRDIPMPADLQKIVTATADNPKGETVKRMILRSLKRAEYADVPAGHFGLAAPDYCHFTSPIRRYPDLEVHRMLKLMLRNKKSSYGRYYKHMSELARRCSENERKATKAEWDATDILKAHYMEEKIGEKYEGIVTGVAAWGFFVMLPNTVEGVVRTNTLKHEYELDTTHQALRELSGGRAIQIGDNVRVRVDSVNIILGEVNFILLTKPQKQKGAIAD